MILQLKLEAIYQAIFQLKPEAMYLPASPSCLAEQLEELLLHSAGMAVRI
jgi:hypothetical protein